MPSSLLSRRLGGSPGRLGQEQAQEKGDEEQRRNNRQGPAKLLRGCVGELLSERYPGQRHLLPERADDLFGENPANDDL